MYKKESFAENLRFYRKKLGLTQQQLGNMVSYSGKAVSKWESGNVFPPTEALLRLTEILKTDLNALFALREAPSYFLGVDGGGTKTEFVLADSDNNIIMQDTLGPCNAINMDSEEIEKVITDGIKSVCRDVPPGQISAFFGISGAGTQKSDRIYKFLKKFGFFSVGLGTDAQNIISAGLNGRNGIIAILGTGSVVFASKDGSLKRFGGYGNLLGDYASGYEIGKSGLSAVLAAADLSGPETLLSDMFSEKTKRNIFDVLPLFYKNGKSYISSFAPMVFEAYRRGDGVARQIIRDNIKKFSCQLKAAAALFGGSEIPVVLSGGLTREAEVILPLFKDELGDEKVKFEILREKPVMGAVRLAEKAGGDLND